MDYIYKKNDDKDIEFNSNKIYYESIGDITDFDFSGSYKMIAFKSIDDILYII